MMDGEDNSLLNLPPTTNQTVDQITDSPNSLDELLSQIKVVKLINPITEGTVYLVGTAHVSRASEEDVRQVIRITKPDTVLIELCRSRVALLAPPPPQNETITFAQALSKAQDIGIFAALLGYFYSGVRDKLGIVPGAEFRAAYEEGNKIPDCNVILGDRPVEITLSRTWYNLTLFERIRLIWTLLLESYNMDISEEDIERMKDTDFITKMLKELSIQFPGVSRPLIYERDEYLTWSLKQCNGKTVVGVVGLGHVAGIQKCWDTQIDVDSLVRMPPPTYWTLKRTLLMVGGTLVLSLALLVKGIWSFF